MSVVTLRWLPVGGVDVACVAFAAGSHLAPELLVLVLSVAEQSNSER